MSDSLLDTVVAKSDQMNAADLVGGPVTVTITGVKKVKGDDQQPVHIAIEGRQPWKPCKTMRRLLLKVWGDTSDTWSGRQITLYCDPAVRYGSDAVGGIRISYMSHMDKESLTIPLPVSRGKSAQFTVKRLEVAPAKPAKSDIAALRAALKDAEPDADKRADIYKRNGVERPGQDAEFDQFTIDSLWQVIESINDGKRE